MFLACLLPSSLFISLEIFGLSPNSKEKFKTFSFEIIKFFQEEDQTLSTLNCLF